MNRVFKNIAIYLLIVLAAYFIFSQFSVTPPQADPFNNNYTAFYKALEKGEVKNLTIIQGKMLASLKVLYRMLSNLK